MITAVFYETYYCFLCCVGNFCKSKAITTTHHGGMCYERQYSFCFFITMALDGGEWSCLGHILLHGTHYVRGCVGPRPVCWLKQNSFALPGIETWSLNPLSNTILTELLHHLTSLWHVFFHILHVILHASKWCKISRKLKIFSCTAIKQLLENKIFCQETLYDALCVTPSW